MLDFMKGLSASASAMQAQQQRLRLVSENMANADTPGYRRKLPIFGSTYAGVQVQSVRLDQAKLRQKYQPSHPLADGTGHVSYSNVNMITEIGDAREAQRSFEANLNMFDQSRRMYANALEILKR